MREQAEKLATAAYLVSALMRDDEPLKRRVRDGALELAGDTALFVEKAKKPEHTEALAAAIVSEIRDIVFLIETGHAAGLISAMNRDVIVREYGALAQMCADIRDQRKAIDESVGSLFAGELATPQPASRIPQPISQRHSQGQNSKRHSPTAGQPNGRKDKILSIIKDRGSATLKDIASVLKDTGEKTLQRDLLALAASGAVHKKGERRWTIYSVAV